MRHRPLLLWTAAFVGGIGAGTAGITNSPLPLAALAAAGLACLATGGRRIFVVALGLLLAGVAAGALRQAVYKIVAPDDVSRFAGQSATILGTVVSDPDERSGRTTLHLRAQTVTRPGVSMAVTGEIYVAFSPNAKTVLDYGDLVALDGILETPPDATNPGAFSWRDYLARRGIYSQMRVRRPGAARRLGASHLNPFLRFAWETRRRTLDAIQNSLPPTPAAILSGILLGRRAELPPDLMADFIHTGTVHILASAGLHVGIVAFWLLFLFERLTLPRKVSAVLIIALLWLFAAMAGGRPAVTRAVVMATFYFAAILLEREPDLPTTVGAAALIILLLQPTALVEAGFLLSFLTVLTLAITMPVWDAFWRPRLERRFRRPFASKAAVWTMEMLGLSLLAQVGSAPIVALAYNEISLSGFWANFLVVPALFILIPAGFLGAILAQIFVPAAALCFAVCHQFLTYIAFVVRGFGESAWAYRAVSSPSTFAIILYYCAVYGAAYALSTRLVLARSRLPFSHAPRLPRLAEIRPGFGQAARDDSGRGAG